jgi:Domain of unknown function (DUF4365)
MGYVWRPLQLMDAGIDGYIEIRDPATGEMSLRQLAVQSKAYEKRSFNAETETSFSYTPSEADLKYWLGGNLPVILVLSRPDTGAVYWVSINEYYKDLNKLKQRKIIFDKTAHRLTKESATALAMLALPKELGLYTAPVPKTEQLVTNLLPVAFYPPRLYMAETPYRKRHEIWKKLRDHELDDVSPEWILKSGFIYSFHNLREEPWPQVCDRGTVDDFETQEWAETDDLDKKNEFIELLEHCLDELFYQPYVSYHERFKCHYFEANDGLKNRIEGNDETGRARTVVQNMTRDPKYPCYRHYALESAFVRYDLTWHLELIPTYIYTSNGFLPYKFHAELLKGMKRLEKHGAISHLNRFWESFLSTQHLFFDTYPLLKFGSLANLTLDVGIEEKVWRPASEEDLGNLIDAEEALKESGPLFQ